MEGNYKKWIDRINAKQDVLTDDNVGEFMLSELSTKSAPTSGDTILARDILTNKAVEIPIESLGGGDTSNLVPYTGANKHVNVGAYYFESSLGFKKAGGTANQALTANGGVFDLNTKADLEGGKVPATQLPSYVDDVLEFANLASFPATGENGKIYIAIDTNLTYRWGGSSYVVMSSSLALGETSSTAYRGDRGKIAYDHSQVTHDKTLVGLGNVDNTSDLNKPISTAVQIELDNLENSKQKKLSVITIVGNITLSEIHNGAILHITNTCNITIPTGLGADFSCDCYVKGAFIATFVNGGVTLNSPSGLLLKTDKMCTLYSNASDVFNLLGELATS